MTEVLAGIKVLDLTRLLPGAYCTMVLADFGAEVIKVEQPGSGDPMRHAPPCIDGVGVRFGMVNRGKRSLCVNLKHAQGRAAFLRLAAGADVVVEGFRPGAMRRLRLDYETLSAANPRLIYCALTGYGQDGPLAEAAGHDLNYSALAGALEMNGQPGQPPAPPFTQVADLAAGGLTALGAILLALLARERTGKGQFLDVSMFDGLLNFQIEAAAYTLVNRQPSRGQTRLTGQFACYAVYETGDGRHIAVGALESKFWAGLCRFLGLEDLIPLQFAAGEVQTGVKQRLAERFRTRTLDAWVQAMEGAETCCTPVLGMAEALAQPVVRARGLWRTDLPAGVGPQFGSHFCLSDTPAQPFRPAPALGADTEEVLRAAGFDAAEVAALRAAGAIA